jgi:hypothetical protein
MHVLRNRLRRIKRKHTRAAQQPAQPAGENKLSSRKIHRITLSLKIGYRAMDGDSLPLLGGACKGTAQELTF